MGGEKRLLSVVLAAGLAPGCATVDPRADYARAGGYIAGAVGMDVFYDPNDDAAAASRVRQLLEGGLTAEEAVQVSLLNNPGLQGLYFGLGMRRADVVQSGLLSNPSIGVASRLPAGGGLVNIEASVAQNVADLWRIPLRKQRAERELERAVLELAHRAAGAAADARAGYYRAVAADRLVEIAELNRASAMELLNLTERLRDAGAASGVDVNLSRSELQEAELQVRAANLAAFEARMELWRLLGLTEADEPMLTDGLPEPPDVALSIEAVLRAAAGSRLDIAAARQGLEALAAEVRLERKSVFRVVEIGLELEREARERSGDGAFLGNTARSSIAAGGLSLPPGFGDEDEEAQVVFGPSLTVELPLFDQNQAAIAKAEFAYLQAVREVQALLLDITRDARLAHRRAAARWETARFYARELVPLRETNLELAREAYQAGKVAIIPVIEAQRDVQESRAAFVQALFDAAAAWIDLERVTARPREALIEQAP